MLIRDRKKEGRKKQARSNKQSKATQHTHIYRDILPSTHHAGFTDISPRGSRLATRARMWPRTGCARTTLRPGATALWRTLSPHPLADQNADPCEIGQCSVLAPVYIEYHPPYSLYPSTSLIMHVYTLYYCSSMSHCVRVYTMPFFQGLTTFQDAYNQLLADMYMYMQLLSCSIIYSRRGRNYCMYSNIQAAPFFFTIPFSGYFLM